MIERLAKLEQRLDSVLPMLCTKADLESLRADVHRGLSEIKKWMITTIFALLIGLCTIGNFIWNSVRAMVVDARLVASSEPATSSARPIG
ncbi:hypothetical protein LK996_07055 [Lysobacter sp. A6]|uniref:Uncharacterized protein n=1 Tax=Noviluteimonas lactosilytica TaxID=2888523 RepID=A0ABS8JGV8_9GAMM|nr:hypothetical protein [Lysobacter lactosilyticus]MCC8362834.1 hypothetical protein [Lysobacter lactosilyticus]